jgi:hypothetical protein
MSKRLTNEIVDETLKDRPIKRVGDYVEVNTPTEFQCLKNTTHPNWFARPCNVLFGTNCPTCAGTSKLTNKIIDQRLQNRPIKRLGDYINNHTKIDFQC